MSLSTSIAPVCSLGCPHAGQLNLNTTTKEVRSDIRPAIIAGTLLAFGAVFAADVLSERLAKGRLGIGRKHLPAFGAALPTIYFYQVGRHLFGWHSANPVLLLLQSAFSGR